MAENEATMSAMFRGGQIPESVRARILAGQLMAQSAGAPSAPYTSKGVVGLKALQGFLGGQMESSAIQNETQAQAAHRMAVANLLGTTAAGNFGSGSAGATPGAASSATGSAPQPSTGGAGSDYVAGRQGASHAAWLASIMPEAQRISAQTGVDARIIAAQAAHESNYGQSAPGGNLFGIKGAGTGPISTMESVNGVMTPTKASFAAYDSPAAAFDGYGKLMSGPRYAGVRNGQGMDEQLAALGKSGYATDPNYASKVGTIARSIPLPSASGVPQGPTTASADMPAPNAQPVAANTLPPDITPDMVSAAPQKPSLDAIVTGAMAKAGMDTSGLPSSATQPVSLQNAQPSGAAPPLDPEGTGSANYDTSAQPLMGTSPAALAQALQSFKPSLGQAQAAVVPPPVSASAPPLPPAPSTLPPSRPPSGDVAGAPVVPPPAADDQDDGSLGPSTLPPPGAPTRDTASGPLQVGVKPSLDALVTGAMGKAGYDTSGLPGADPVGAGLAAGRDVALDPVVPDPQGSLVPPSPSSPNGALVGPQSDAAMGNDGGAMGAPVPPQASLPATAPLPPPGAQSIQASADAARTALATALGSGSTSSSAPLPTFAQAGMPSPSPMPPQGSAGAASPPAGPMPPHGAQPMGMGSNLPQTGPMPPLGAQSLAPNHDVPAQNAVQAGPAPIPPQAMAAALQSFGGSGTNAPAGNAPSVDPSSPQNFMRQEIARQLGGGAPSAPAASPPVSSASPASQGSIGGGLGGMLGSLPIIGDLFKGSGSGGQAPSPAPYGGQGQQPGQSSAPSASGPGGMNQQQMFQALMNDPRTTSAEAQLIMSRLYPTPEKIAAGDGLVMRQPDGSYRNVYSQPSKDQYTFSPDGVHVLNKGTGDVTMPNGSGGSGAAGWRPMTPAEMQSYGITDGRPAYMAPNGEPHFGMPGAAGQGETEEAKKAGSAAADRRNDMIAAANSAPEKIARLKLLGTVLDNTATGPLAPEIGNAGAIATRLGVAPERLAALGIDPNQPVNNAIANKLAGEMTMSSIGAKNGGMPASNFSVAERQFIEGLYPNIENQAGGNRAVTDVLTAVEQKKMQWADAWSDYKDQQAQTGKPLSYENFEDQFRRAHSQDNIFAPIMQKYQAGGYTPTMPSANGVPTTPQPGQGQPGAMQQGAPPSPTQGGQNAPPQLQGGQGQGADPLSQARAAIARGAPRAAVIQRLQGMGINAAGL